MSLKDYKAMPVNEYQNNQNRQNVDRAMKEGANSSAKTGKMEGLYSSAEKEYRDGHTKEGDEKVKAARAEAQKVKENIRGDYNSKKSEINKNYCKNCDKINSEKSGSERKRALEELNKKREVDVAKLERNRDKELEEVEKKQKDAEEKTKAASQNESVARSR